ncbi:ABC transporter permease [Clostridium sp. PL3]|uniref:ABC transporter permease n=1 Tax=Clostridium thailandense TaxID=2794346 RepID=A0A949X5V6_9CLOT|nr:ABC transporter permease [Clostridium thailandense]MBV7276258.1 ABC transporter permease [Clostridium thailandense]
MKKAFKAELLKLRHSNMLSIAMFMPIFFVIMGLSNFLRYKELFTSKGQNVWQQIYTQSSLFYGLFIIPLFITIIIAILVRIENSEDNFKRIITLPVKRSDIFMAKLIVGCIIVLLNLILFMALVILAGLIIAPGGQSMPMNLVYSPVLCFIAALPVIALQYYLSMKFSNIAVPLGIGVIFSVPAVLINNTKYWVMFPWIYPGRAILYGANIGFQSPLYMYIIGIVVFVIFIFLGVYEFNNKDI